MAEGKAEITFKEVNNWEFPKTDRHQCRNSSSFVIPWTINTKKITPRYITVKISERKTTCRVVKCWAWWRLWLTGHTRQRCKLKCQEKSLPLGHRTVSPHGKEDIHQTSWKRLNIRSHHSLDFRKTNTGELNVIIPF